MADSRSVPETLRATSLPANETPPPLPSNVKEAIDRYFQAVVAYHRWRDPDIEDSQARAIEMGETRSVVESLFLKQQQEIEAARRTGDYWKAELNAANAELASLKKEQRK